MMEENNRKGPGIFYAVVGVATLVVAIIGATFAYFSASVSANGNENVRGETLDVTDAVLSASVEKVTFAGAVSPSNNLVPAFFGKEGDTLNVATPAALTKAHVETLLSNKCENATDKYTGCHVYRITATSSQTVADADVLLSLTTTGADNSQWGYVVFTADGDVAAASATNVTLVGTPAAIGDGVNGLDIHGKGLTVADEEDDVTVTYYLLVYVNDTDNVQNDKDTTATNVTGNYSGSITFQAAGGQVRATFAA